MTKNSYNVGKNHPLFGKTGELSATWKGGKPHCLDCGKILSTYKCKKCSSCAKKGNTYAMIDGNFSKKHYCIDCKTEVFYKSIRCKKCNYKFSKGENSTNFKDGVSVISHYCTCGKEITYQNWLYGKKGCKSCSAKIRSAEIPNKRCLNPNKPEKILIELFKKFNINFKYVGNSKFYVDRFNPDFIDKKNKKIIEFNGTYWHTKDDYVINKDNEKLRTYTEHGYSTLIIWDKELGDTDKLIDKVKLFNRGV
jgi:very-short-patch-repair endonuclease